MLLPRRQSVENLHLQPGAGTANAAEEMQHKLSDYVDIFGQAVHEYTRT